MDGQPARVGAAIEQRPQLASQRAHVRRHREGPPQQAVHARQDVAFLRTAGIVGY
jgi:hypothetical protein